MMQKIRIWFQTEYRRACAILPRLMVVSAIITVVMGVLLHGFVSYMEKRQSEEQSRIRIGYVAEEDMLTKLLVSYVAGMDSVDEWCRFVSVTEEEGREELQEGKLAALLILPENVVDEILSGNNAPATLILPAQSSALGIVFEELADAGIRMLSVAQGEIYAVYELANVLGLTKEQLLGICDEINTYNMGLVMKRETWFQAKKVSVTGNEEMAVYYGSALAAFWLIMCGVCFGSYIKHSEQEELLLWKRLGVTPVIQLTGRILVTAVLLIMTLLSLTGLWLLPWLREELIPVFSWQSLVVILLSVVCVSTYDMLIYQLSEQHRTAIVVAGLFAVLQGYVAGCLVPTVLLPQVIQEFADFLPASYIRQAFSLFFSGNTQQTSDICKGLLVFIILFLLINIGVMYYKTGIYAKGKVSVLRQEKEQRIHVRGTVFHIYIKRMLYRKSFWCSLLIIALLSVWLVSLERQSETRITAAFCDESGEWEELLREYDGYIQFLACDSEDEVRELVLHDKVECGYRIPKDFRERVQNGDAKKSIALYKDADAFMADTINEILFEKLFMQLSKEWFAAYMEEADMLFSVLEHKMTDGSTFRIEKEYWQTDIEESTSEQEERTTYPIMIVVITAIVLCGLSGIWEAIEDFHRYRFFKRKAAVMVSISILQPILCGLLMGILMFLVNSY
ncbi:MAG: ABC transporter permease [Lachnospiraceae bacterium]|nr:ABC transporter permease [Lachnospiraceae bacterium]